MLIVGCSPSSDITSNEKDMQPTGILPPSLIQPPLKCKITADKYQLPVGMQNMYYLSGEPMTNCELVIERQGTEPILDRIIKTNSKGLKSEMITHAQTGVYNIWIVCGKCTSDKLKVTVTAGTNLPPQPDPNQQCYQYSVQNNEDNWQPNTVDDARCQVIAANHCSNNGIKTRHYSNQCCAWSCNQAQPVVQYSCCLVSRRHQCVQGTRCSSGISRGTYNSLAECQAQCSDPDYDGDGVPNTIDKDDDNDGYSDVLETSSNTNPQDAASHPSLSENDQCYYECKIAHYGQGRGINDWTMGGVCTQESTQFICREVGGVNKFEIKTLVNGVQCCCWCCFNNVKCT